MSISDMDGKTAVMGIFGSLLAYMFYGRIQDASDIQSLKQEMIQVKTEQVDLWSKYNDDIKEKGQMMMNMANYMIEEEKAKGELGKEISRVELENIKAWLEHSRE
jgi:hypothetical protein